MGSDTNPQEPVAPEQLEQQEQLEQPEQPEQHHRLGPHQPRSREYSGHNPAQRQAQEPLLIESRIDSTISVPLTGTNREHLSGTGTGALD